MLFIALFDNSLVDFRVQIYLFFRLWGIFVRKVGFGSFFRGGWGGVVGGVGYFLLNIFWELYTC